MDDLKQDRGSNSEAAERLVTIKTRDKELFQRLYVLFIIIHLGIISLVVVLVLSMILLGRYDVKQISASIGSALSGIYFHYQLKSRRMDYWQASSELEKSMKSTLLKVS